MLKRILVKFALKILKMEVLDKIQYAPAQSLLTLGYSGIEKAADIVLDGNPDNKAQFAALWQEQKKDVILTAIDTTKAILIEEIDDPRTENYTVGLLDEIRAEVEAGNIIKKLAA